MENSAPVANNPPVAVCLECSVTANRFRRESIAINRQIEFVAENFESADVIAVLVCENNAIELLRRDAALFKAQHQLSRA